MTPDEIKQVAAQLAVHLKADPAVIGPNGNRVLRAAADPVAPSPWANVDWHKLLQTVGTIFITMVVVPVLAYYGYNLPSNAEAAKKDAAAAVQQSEKNSAEIKTAHAENVASVEAVHQDVKATGQKVLAVDRRVADAAKAAAKKPDGDSVPIPK
jgi:uncharacterized iron-regulated membrane protein